MIRKILSLPSGRVLHATCLYVLRKTMFEVDRILGPHYASHGALEGGWHVAQFKQHNFILVGTSRTAL
ncbi:hypothetical protein T4E_11358 [Trichinella pseudospiralis]|uniref:Uncharacterized protein n=1 Tax=Trichinella pseudospiralis TaxID=6337 RepID=A0A0V0YK82_TRIPS|nr:hypothetical protein T4E_11358 [Trichinella pseudospiralis]